MSDYYPAGAANDPYAPYNYVACPDCDEEMPAPEMRDHLEGCHDWEPDVEALADAAAEARAYAWRGEP